MPKKSTDIIQRDGGRHPYVVTAVSCATAAATVVPENTTFAFCAVLLFCLLLALPERGNGRK